MILACNHIEKKFNDEALFSDVSFHINEHECTALVGVNGTGKTTLLRIIVGELPADNGDVILAKDTSVGYLPQQQGYHSDKSIYDELWEVKKDIVALEREIRTMEETMQTASGEELNPLLERYHRMQTEFEAKDGYACKSQIMGIINGLGFVGNDIDKSINTLSGGQKTRVALGKLLLLEPDLLILDEPTNHLDLASIQWLETYLSNYKGSVLIVSHDRYFLDRVVSRIFCFENGTIKQYEGGYTDYANRKAAEGNTESTGTAAASQPKNADEETTSKNWKNGQKRKLKFTYQEQKDYESIEGEMAALEDKIATLEADFSKYASDFVKLNELTQEKEAAEQQLEEKMERWMYLEDLAARIERGEEN